MVFILKKSLTKLQKICIIGFCLAFIIFIISGIILIRYREEAAPDTNADKTEEGLADELLYYPDKIVLNRPLDEIALYDKDGNEFYLSDYKGKNVILLFWTSWCKYCNEEFELLPEYQSLFAEYEDVEFILINKLDGEKETKEKAEEYIKKNNITFTNYYDMDLKIYHSLGLKVVPTFMGFDKKGVLRFCYPENMNSIDQMRAYINYLRDGSAKATEEFITNKLTNLSGGVYVNYEESDAEGPSGHDILSESQGIMMEYAVMADNKELFERYLKFVTKNMLNNNTLTGWMVSETDSQKYHVSTVNSMIDDLRIYGAVCAAKKRWGGYQELKEQWENAIQRYNIEDNNFVDFYDFKSDRKAERLTLCFADLQTIREMKDVLTNAPELYDNTYRLVTEGYIGDEFPLYYSWYDYATGQYQRDDLNMAEALVTLLHLAEVGDLKQETLTWLKTTMSNGGIKARYTVKGEVVKGYNYESTAINALLVMIASEVNDDVLMTQALSRMELMRIYDQSSDFNGSFGMGDGEDIFSFDQCTALLAYAYAEKRN